MSNAIPPSRKKGRRENAKPHVRSHEQPLLPKPHRAPASSTVQILSHAKALNPSTFRPPSQGWNLQSRPPPSHPGHHILAQSGRKRKRPTGNMSRSTRPAIPLENSRSNPRQRHRIFTPHPQENDMMAVAGMSLSGEWEPLMASCNNDFERTLVYPNTMQRLGLRWMPLPPNAPEWEPTPHGLSPIIGYTKLVIKISNPRLDARIIDVRVLGEAAQAGRLDLILGKDVVKEVPNSYVHTANTAASLTTLDTQSIATTDGFGHVTPMDVPGTMSGGTSGPAEGGSSHMATASYSGSSDLARNHDNFPGAGGFLPFSANPELTWDGFQFETGFGPLLAPDRSPFH